MAHNPIAAALAALDFPGAACAGEATVLFFGPERRGRESAAARSAREVRVALAKELCGLCPHRVACRDHALTYPEADGIWGGLTAEERRRLAAAAA